MTLSHHWSDTEPVKLLKSNLQAFQISIPFNTLLLKYQDAMKIAKQLGVRWLWIDCLCIVQDSVKDWYQESACMELVYSNSFCNITAGLANAEDSGCFFSRNPLQWEPFHIVNPLKAPPHIFRVTRLHHSPPIFKRGWVFQERLLCPRNVIFDKELLWECRETTVSELCPTPVNVKHTADIVLDFKNKVAPCPEQRWVDLGFHHSWTQMVTYYTMSNLTVPTDKLVALSGVAFAMSRLSPGDQYLAGIWRSQLPQGLLWQGPLWNTRPQEYLGPTWSWASSEGAVSFGEANSLENPHLDDVWAKVVKVGTVPFSEKSTSRRREFGRLKGGHVVLDAPIAIVNLTSPPFPVLQLREVVAQEQSWDLLALSKHNWVRWEGPVDSQILRPVLSVSLSGRGSRSTSSSMAEFVSTGIGPGSLCCVPLLHRPFTVDRAPFLPDDGVHGLLLFYHGQGFFTRAGCFNIAGDDKIIALFKNLPKKRVLIL
jgi:hypothetical protein